MLSRLLPISARSPLGPPTHLSDASSDHFDPFDDPTDDWEGIEPDPLSDPLWDPQELDEDDEPLPEGGDFWVDPDELENYRPLFNHGA